MDSQGATEEIDLYGEDPTRRIDARTNFRIAILGISKSATKSEIKKAYHKVRLAPAPQALALITHRRPYNTTQIRHPKTRERRPT
jgi:hypothetical protein